MKLWESRFDPVDLWEKKCSSDSIQFDAICFNFFEFQTTNPHRIQYVYHVYLYLVNFSWVSCQVNWDAVRFATRNSPDFEVMGFEASKDGTETRSAGPKFSTEKFRKTWSLEGEFCHPGFVFWFLLFSLWDLKGEIIEIDLRQIEGGPPGPSKICCECADFQMLFQLDDFKSVKKDWLIHLSLGGKPPGASNTSVFSFVIASKRCNGYFWYQMIAQPVPWSCHGPWSFSEHLPYKLQVCYYVSSFQLNWLVLSDEQMSKGWQFFLLYKWRANERLVGLSTRS